MRSLLALLLLAATCAFAPAAPAQLEGSYVLAQIQGQSLPAPSASEPMVMIGTMTLLLKPDETYEMELTGSHTPSGRPIAVDMTGTYQVEGDGLTLHPEQTAHTQPASYRWTLDGATLTLTDEGGALYTFARQ